MDDSRVFVFILILISIILIWEHYIKIIPSSVFAVILGMFVSILWKVNMDSTLDFAPEIFLYLMLNVCFSYDSNRFFVCPGPTEPGTSGRP